MANYRRLISYIYAYEGGVKGKNIGYAKIEVRGEQCRIQVNVKKIYVGSNDIGVFLLAPGAEIQIGKIFVRSGSGEFRINVLTSNVENSGHSIDQCYGLSVHDVESTWQCYTTIWEDAVAQAAEIHLADVTAENLRAKEAEVKTDREQPELSVSAEIEQELAVEERKLAMVAPWEAEQPKTVREQTVDREEIKMPEFVEQKAKNEIARLERIRQERERLERERQERERQERERIQQEGERREREQLENEQRERNERERLDRRNRERQEHERMERQQRESQERQQMEREQMERQQRESQEREQMERQQRESQEREQMERQQRESQEREQMERQQRESQERERMERRQTERTEAQQEQERQQIAREQQERQQLEQPRQEWGAREGQIVVFPEQTETLPALESEEKLEELERMEKAEKDKNQIWEQMARNYIKVLAFEYDNGCEILSIKPQDIGLLPRDIWVYGNNSFLLHGYYNYRHLILARLNNPQGNPRFLLGVPGHYFSNEKNMASMFGFPHFVLAKKQPEEDGRFGYWYTDIRL